MDELYGRITAPQNPHTVQYGDITDACGWSPDTIGTQLDAEGIKKEMDPLVADASVVLEWTGGPEVAYSAITGIVQDNPSSYPIPTLGPEYFSDDAIPYRTRGVPESLHHNGIVVRAEEDEVHFYDPLARYKSPGDAPEEWVVVMPRVRFMQYWENDAFPREVMWFTLREGGLPVFT